MFVDNSRSTGAIVINAFLVKISKIKLIEKNAASNNAKKLKKYKNSFVQKMFCNITKFQKSKIW